MHFSMKNKDYIYSSLSSSDNIKGIIHICHGKGEHIGRYSWLTSMLNSDGYHVISMAVSYTHLTLPTTVQV